MLLIDLGLLPELFWVCWFQILRETRGISHKPIRMEKTQLCSAMLFYMPIKLLEAFVPSSDYDLLLSLSRYFPIPCLYSRLAHSPMDDRGLLLYVWPHISASTSLSYGMWTMILHLIQFPLESRTGQRFIQREILPLLILLLSWLL